MKKIIYAYRLTNDTGFAPCVDDNILTLACCKGGRISNGKTVCTGLRHTIGKEHLGKNEDEVYLFGIYENKLIYFARVDKIITMKEYFSEQKYKHRKDQIYSVNEKGKLYRNDNLPHVHGKNEPDQNKRDIAGRYVLISNHFIYFGRNCEKIDDELLKFLPKFQENKHYDANDGDIYKKLYDFAVKRGFDETKAIKLGEPHTPLGENHAKGNCGGCGPKVSKEPKMRIILSRKGFDSENGGIPSPVLPDGTMLSLPIPGDDKGNFPRFSDIKFRDNAYLDIITSLRPKFEDERCHLDPDIRTGAISPPNWVEAFGQCDTALSHLNKQEVGVGDLFLFFGWFRKTEEENGKLKFIENDFHAIWGYMQIGKIVTGNEIKKYGWHPHADKIFLAKKNNALYLPAENLTIDGVDTGKKGCGVLKFNENLVLTKGCMTCSKWELLDWMIDAEISYHKKESINSEYGYFQSTAKGQEFVIQPHAGAIEWAKDLILGS